MINYDYKEEEELSPEELALFKRIRNLSDDEFFAIKPIWETNPEEMQQAIVPNEEWCDYAFVECNLKLLLKQASNISDLRFSRQLENVWWEDMKFATTIERWANGLGVDPSSVNVFPNRVSFTDGRHRARLAEALGADTIVISIRKECLKYAINILDAKEYAH